MKRQSNNDADRYIDKNNNKHAGERILPILLECVLQVSLCYTVLAIVIAGFCSAGMLSVKWYIGGIIYLLPVVAFYIIRKFAQRLWAFLLLHILFTGVMLFIISDDTARNVIVTVTALTAIVSLIIKIQHINERPLLVLGGVYLVAYSFGIYLESDILEKISVAGIGIFGVAQLLHIYLDNMESFFEKNKKNTSVPYYKIRRVSHMMLSLFLLCGSAAIFLVKDVSLNGIIQRLKNILIAIIGWILKSLSSGDAGPIQESEAVTQSNMMDMLPKADNPPPLWAEILNQILMTAAKMVMIAGSLALLIYIAYRIYQKFHNRKNLDTVQESSTFLWQEEKLLKKNKRGFLRGLTGRGNNNRIRKMYKKFVQNKYRIGRGNKSKKIDIIPMHYTPQELQQNGYPDIKSGTKITTYYEKARYGNEECTAEDVSGMKKSLGEG